MYLISYSAPIRLGVTTNWSGSSAVPSEIMRLVWRRGKVGKWEKEQQKHQKKKAQKKAQKKRHKKDTEKMS